MNKFKLVLWIIILGIIALVIFQNQTFFLGSQSLRINLWVAPEYQTPPIPIAGVLLIFFIFGLLLTWLFSIPERLRNRKAIKRLNALNASQQDEMAGLQKQIAALKGESVATVEHDARAAAANAGASQDDLALEDTSAPTDASKN